jgi:hypothetical protein
MHPTASACSWEWRTFVYGVMWTVAAAECWSALRAKRICLSYWCKPLVWCVFTASSATSLRFPFRLRGKALGTVGIDARILARTAELFSIDQLRAAHGVDVHYHPVDGRTLERRVRWRHSRNRCASVAAEGWLIRACCRDSSTITPTEQAVQSHVSIDLLAGKNFVVRIGRE